jgi:hypothetical protein
MFGTSPVDFELSEELVQRLKIAITAGDHNDLCKEIAALIVEGTMPIRKDGGDSFRGKFTRGLHRRIEKFLSRMAKSTESQKHPVPAGIKTLSELDAEYLMHIESSDGF